MQLRKDAGVARSSTHALRIAAFSTASTGTEPSERPYFKHRRCVSWGEWPTSVHTQEAGSERLRVMDQHGCPRSRPGESKVTGRHVGSLQKLPEKLVLIPQAVLGQPVFRQASCSNCLATACLSELPPGGFFLDLVACAVADGFWTSRTVHRNELENVANVRLTPRPSLLVTVAMPVAPDRVTFGTELRAVP